MDVVVIGAGAAGLMAAAKIASRGLSTILIEHNRQVGRKILISGGGRCNFTNLEVFPQDYHSENEHFAKSALSRYTPDDFIDLVKSYNIEFYEKKLGQLFCQKSAKDIVDMLLSECRRANVELRIGQKVLAVERVDETSFKIQTANDSILTSALVVATGGLSLDAIGATDFGYRLARQFNLKVTQTRPALVPLVFAEDFSDLSGVSLPAQIQVADRSYTDDLLFTHKGLSGPVILKASLFWNPSEALIINFLPEMDLLNKLKELKLKRPKLQIDNALKETLPNRLVEFFFNRRSWPTKTLADFSYDLLEQVALQFQAYELIPKETQGYRKSEVTRGGVATDELSSKSFEARKVPGLYFIGEVVDVTGLLGGYNFQWAWASAHAVAENIIPLDQR